MLGAMVAKEAAEASVVPADVVPGAAAADEERGEHEDDLPVLALEEESAAAPSQAVTDARMRDKKKKIPKGREGLLLNALVADPRNVDALTRLGLLYEQRGQHSKSIELLFRATKVDPKRTQYLFVHIAHAHLCQHQWQQTLETVEHATTHPENRIAPMLHYTIGRLYDRVDQRQVSEPALRQCLKLSPWYPESREVFFRLGCMYREMRKYERAFYCMNKAVTDGNGEGFFDLSVIWLELGVVARLINKRAEAEAAFANSGLDPDEGAAWHYAGNDYLGKLEYLKAFRCFRKAVALDPENHDLWASLIDLYRTMGQNEEALEAYYGFATIDAAAKLRKEHASTYSVTIDGLEAQLAEKEAALAEKESARRNIEALASQQQKILQGLNDDLENQRQSRSARESFLEMQLKEAIKKDGQLKQREEVRSNLLFHLVHKLLLFLVHKLNGWQGNSQGCGFVCRPWKRGRRSGSRRSRPGSGSVRSGRSGSSSSYSSHCSRGGRISRTRRAAPRTATRRRRSDGPAPRRIRAGGGGRAGAGAGV